MRVFVTQGLSVVRWYWVRREWGWYSLVYDRPN